MMKTSQNCTDSSAATIKSCYVFITGFVITCFITVFEHNWAIKTSHDFITAFQHIMMVVLLQARLGTFQSTEQCCMALSLKSGV